MKTVFCGEASDADIKLFAALVAMESLHVGPDILQPFEGLRHITKMAQLRSLDLSQTKATNAGMAYVAQMSGLETLKVNYTMGDAGLAHLNVMPNLDDLDLTGSKVTDAGLATLIGLPKLRRLGSRAHSGYRRRSGPSPWDEEPQGY